MMAVETLREDRILQVDFSRRLPDVNSCPPEYDEYGRLAILRNGELWVGIDRSSHPATTENGFYYALIENTIYFSPRGAALDFEKLITEDLIKQFVKKSGLRKRFSYFKIVS